MCQATQNVQHNNIVDKQFLRRKQAMPGAKLLRLSGNVFGRLYETYESRSPLDCEIQVVADQGGTAGSNVKKKRRIVYIS